MPTQDYITDLYNGLSNRDKEFSSQVSLEKFRQSLQQDEKYASSMYDFLAQEEEYAKGVTKDKFYESVGLKKKELSQDVSSQLSENPYVASPESLPTEQIKPEKLRPQTVQALDTDDITKNIAEQNFRQQFGDEMLVKAQESSAKIPEKKIEPITQKPYETAVRKADKYEKSVIEIDKRLEALKQKYDSFGANKAYSVEAEKYQKAITEYERQKKVISGQLAIQQEKLPIEKLKNEGKIVEAEEAERGLKKATDRGRAMTYLGGFNNAVAQGVLDIGKAAMIIPSLVPLPHDPNWGGNKTKEEIMNSAIYKGMSNMQDWANKYFKGNPIIEQEFGNKLATGGGSLALFMAGGSMAGGSKVAQWLVPSLMGGALNATGEMEAAIERTEDANNLSKEEYLYKYQLPKGGAVDVLENEYESLKGKNPYDIGTDVFLADFAVGTLEGLPVSQFLTRLDKASKGEVKKYMARTGVQGMKDLFSKVDDTVLGKGVLGAIEESGQEIMTNWLTNVVASKTYDQSRELIEGLEESGTVGGVLGFAMNTMVGLLGMRMKKAKTPQERKELGAALKYIEGKIAEHSGKGETEIIKKEPSEAVAELEKQKLEIINDLANKDLPETVKIELENKISTIDSEIEKQSEAEREELSSVEKVLMEEQSIDDEIEELEGSLLGLNPESVVLVQKRIDELKAEKKRLGKDELVDGVTITQEQDIDVDNRIIELEGLIASDNASMQETGTGEGSVGVGGDVESKKAEIKKLNDEIDSFDNEHNSLVDIVNKEDRRLNTPKSENEIKLNELLNKINTLIDKRNKVEQSLKEQPKIDTDENTTELLPNTLSRTEEQGSIRGGIETEEDLIISEEERTQEALNEAEKRRKEGKYNIGDRVVERNPKKIMVGDKKGVVRFANDVSVPFTYKLIEADELQPSHQQGVRNEKHFIPETQPKSRTDEGSIVAEDSFAENPRFDELGENTNAYSGASIVNERGEVIQGNNRAAGLKKGYKVGNTKYKSDLEANAEKFGFTKEQVQGMKNPILVREVKVSDDAAIEFGNYDVKDLETGGKRRIDPIATTRRMPFSVKGKIANLVFSEEGKTLNASIRSNQDKVIELLSPFINQAQRNTILKDGQLTDAGTQDIEAVILNFLFDNGDAELPTLFEDLSHLQKEGLRKSLPYILGTEHTKSILSEVQNAIIALKDFESSDISDFESWKRQTDMFNEGKTPTDIYTETELKIAEILHSAETQKEIQTTFAKYKEAASGRGGDMFTEATEGKSKAEAIQETFKTKYDERKSKTISSESKENADTEKGKEGSTTEKTRPTKVNGIEFINDSGNVSDDLLNKIEELKNNNDKEGLNNIYDSIKIVLNGVAQSKGGATVEQFTQLKTDLEEYAKSIENPTSSYFRKKAEKIKDPTRPKTSSFGLSNDLLATLYEKLADAIDEGSTVAKAIGKAIKAFDDFLAKNNIRLSVDWDREAFEKSVLKETKVYENWKKEIKEGLSETNGKATPTELKQRLAEALGVSEDAIAESDFNDIYKSALSEYMAAQPSGKEVKKQVDAIAKKDKGETIVTTTVAALKKQIRDFASGVRLGRIDQRKDTKEQQKELNEIKGQVIDIIRQYKPIISKATSVANLIDRIGKIKDVNSLQKALDLVYKIIADSDYVKKVTQAKDNQRKIKKIKKSKVALASDISIAEAFLEINPNEVDDLDAYNEMARNIIEGAKKTSVKLKETETSKTDKLIGKLEGEVKKERELTNDEIKKYIKEELENQEEKAKKKLKEEFSDLFSDKDDFTFKEMQEIISAAYDSDAMKELLEGKKRSEINRKLEIIRDYVNYKLIEANDLFKRDTLLPLAEGTEYSMLSPTEKAIFDNLQKIDTSKLTMQEAAMLSDVIDNIIKNKDFSNAGAVENISLKQQNLQSIKDRFKKYGVTDFYKVKDNIRGALIKAFSSFDLLLEFMSRHGKVAAAIQTFTGIQDLTASNSKVNQLQKEFVDGYKKLIKKIGGDIQSPKNKLIRGVYAFVKQHYGGSESDQQVEFDRLKTLVEENFEILKASNNESLQEEGKLLEEVYNEILKDAKNIKEVEAKVSIGNKKIVDYVKDKWAERIDEFEENSKLYNNKELEPVNNYTSVLFKTIGVGGDSATIDDLVQSVYSKKKMNKRQSGTSIKRARQSSLFSGDKMPSRVINFDFDFTQAKRYREANYEIETQKHRQLISLMLADPEFVEMVGGHENAKLIYDSVVGMINTQNGIVAPTDPLLKKANIALGVVSAKGVRMALSGVSQVIKQYPSVALSTIVNLGTKGEYFFKVPITIDDNFYKYSDMLERGATEAGYTKEAKDFGIDAANFSGIIKDITNEIGEKSEVVKDVLFKPLVGSDIAVAKRSFKAYYAEFLIDNKIYNNFSNIDWDKEAQSPNKEASGYAQQMVSRTQNVNAFERTSSAMRNDGSYKDLFRKVFFPFSGFSTNQRNRMTNDAQKILFGHEKLKSLRSLGAAMGEAVAFNGIKLTVLATLTSMGAKAMLEAFGYDDEDDEEKTEKDKQYKKELWLQNTFMDFFFSGLGTMPPKMIEYGINKLYAIYTGDKKKLIKTYDGEFQKYGVYGILPSKLTDLYSASEYAITGEADKVTGGGLIFEGKEDEIVKKKIKLTERQRNVMIFISFMDALNTIGLSDTELNTIVNKMRRRVQKEIDEETGGKPIPTMVQKKGKSEYKYEKSDEGV